MANTRTKTHKHFNSHAHVERDEPFVLSRDEIIISTHTLTWSVTFSSNAPPITLRNFNSHAHVERDRLRPYKPLRTQHFNSHAHVERDLRYVAYPQTERYFNSHAHVERDFPDTFSRY